MNESVKINRITILTFGRFLTFNLTLEQGLILQNIHTKLNKTPFTKYFCISSIYIVFLHNIHSYFMRFLSLLLILFFTANLHAQLVINEIDVDSPSTDTMEFIELLTDTPEQSLNGFVLVLFNGSNSGGDSSYFALDLDGLTSDVNGVLLIANQMVSPVGDFILFDNTLQNGADAIAVYQGNESDFPDGTLATTGDLVDAIVYDTNDADDTGLLALLGLTEQINEGANGNSDTDSVQRANDGSYFTGTPTPGALNDGSGILFNGIAYAAPQDTYNEGDTIPITFTAQEVVPEDVTFEITLANGTFNVADYTADLQITIPSGSNTSTVNVELIDDSEDEGDEVMQITFGLLPEGFNRLIDNLEIRIIDNDFTSAAWGTPLNPTFDQVESTQPNGYYDPLEGLADTELRQALQDIIADPDVVRHQTYADIIDILKAADQSPLNSNQVWLLYTEQQRPKLDFQTAGGSNVGLWNREHTYPRSRGNFDDIDLDEFADGPDIFVTTNADSLRHANSDAHGLRATDGPENSSRGNQDYGEYSGPDDTAGSWQGDVARAIFFLSVRYNDIDVVSGNPTNSTVGLLGDLDVLLEWHQNDPPDDYEMNRNNTIYTWQFNRNPFIDQPDLADFIWGDNVGEAYQNPLSTANVELQQSNIFPNPASNNLQITSTNILNHVRIYSTTGQLIKENFIPSTIGQIQLDLAAGIYVLQIISLEGERQIHKLIIN